MFSDFRFFSNKIGMMFIVWIIEFYIELMTFTDVLIVIGILVLWGCWDMGLDMLLIF